jgi:hypothetical protein
MNKVIAGCSAQQTVVRKSLAKGTTPRLLVGSESWHDLGRVVSLRGLVVSLAVDHFQSAIGPIVAQLHFLQESWTTWMAS